MREKYVKYYIYVLHTVQYSTTAHWYYTTKGCKLIMASNLILIIAGKHALSKNV